MDRACFASDNYAPSCPEVRDALEQIDHGAAIAYGDDPATARACRDLTTLFEHECDIYFVFNGTAANSLAIASCCRSYHAVICHELAHIETDECGGPEFFANGVKLLLAPGDDARIDADELEGVARRRTDIHFPKPRVLSLTQATELGTVYTPDHLRSLCDRAHALDMRVHMDGARFANACAALDCSPADCTWRAGVDVLCFGGTKQGMPAGEAVIFFDRALGNEFAWRCKQAGQLASKMRYLAAPWSALLTNDAWLRHAAHANACAARLSAGLTALPGVELIAPTEANEVFVRLSDDLATGLRAAGWRFYDFIGLGGARFVCAWNTEPAWVDQLLADAKASCA
ncbi:MAG: threonine aldolase family protein [Planctomycetota bacterium]